MKLSKKSYFWVVFLTKTTVLTSILTSEVTDMVPQPQYELGKVPGTQSGTWENLVPQMCKSHQTTSVKHIFKPLLKGKTFSDMHYTKQIKLKTLLRCLNSGELRTCIHCQRPSIRRVHVRILRRRICHRTIHFYSMCSVFLE